MGRRVYMFTRLAPRHSGRALGVMNASSEDSKDPEVLAIVNSHYRWRGVRRLLVTLALDA
jgi:hypothetical protein